MADSNLQEKRDRSTIVDVARKASVSYGVAADILRQTSRYSYREETVLRVQQAAQDLEYRPNRMARAMITGRTHQIALSLSSFAPAFINQFVRAIDLLMRDTPYDLLITSHLALLHQDITADGLLFYGAPSKFPITSVLPTVAMGIYYGEEDDSFINHDAVLMDLDGASKAAMNHYLEQGCGRILFVSSSSMMHLQEPRYRAYHNAMTKAGKSLEYLSIDFVIEQSIRQQARGEFQKYFSAHGYPDAIFCSNDDIAISAYRVLRETGKRIPQDIAVLGCDDVEEAPDLTPSLSSIHLPVAEVTQRAWDLLVQRLDHAKRPVQQHKIEADLILRQSSFRINNI